MDVLKYATELKTLVDYQARQGRTVLFRLRLSDDEPPRVVVDTATAVAAESLTGTPILELPNAEPFVLWERDGYIRVVTGGLQHSTSVFRLTEQGIKAVHP